MCASSQRPPLPRVQAVQPAAAVPDVSPLLDAAARSMRRPQHRVLRHLVPVPLSYHSVCWLSSAVRQCDPVVMVCGSTDMFLTSAL